MTKIPLGGTHWVLLNTDRIVGLRSGSVGLAYGKTGTEYHVYFPGIDGHFNIPIHEIEGLDVLKTGKGHPKRICNRCFVLKDTDSFYIVQTDAEGNRTRRPACADCQRLIDGKKLSSTDKRRMQATKPQTGSLFRCPACFRPGIVGVNLRVTINYDHQTGKPRAWICDNCNIGIGRFRDDEEVLEQIQAYLAEYGP